MPVDRKENFGDDLKKMRRLSRPDDGDLTFGGLPAPQLEVPYEVTVKDRKDVFHAITVMKVSAEGCRCYPGTFGSGSVPGWIKLPNPPSSLLTSPFMPRSVCYF